MKVCYTLATSDLEGAARSMLDLIDCDLNNNIEVFVILPKHHNGLEKKLTEKNVNFKVIFHWTDSRGNIFKNILKCIIKKISIIRMKRYFKKNCIDIVHNNSILSTDGMIAAYQLNIPYICHIRENIEEGLQLEVINYNELIYYANNSSCIIAISDYIKTYFQDKVSKKIIKIYDGVQINNYINKEDKNFEKDHFELIIVGRVCEPKGQFDAVQALHELINTQTKKFRLKIVGNISDEAYFEKIKFYIKTNKIDRFIDYVPFTDNLRDIRKNSDICLVCSHNEGLGRVTVEAMLSKELVIGSNCTGTAELIKDGNTGYLYENNNYKSLADTIIRVLNDSDAIKKTAINGQKFAIENFDSGVQGRKVIDIYKKIMEENKYDC